eukprot:CAMPEP_0175741022 /NCGR_PEP_ID=MMETSP0097-20121207/55808_1 /TAXON_ID=311494 /ORGANISM="Alexandrium monilatum, Strain CCMP3105" /LENGTH=115 /DNA_ID=CAMNT_0017049309 /DNA_START=131 /DNA_END=475 /DNA_ORIENTATION=-
MDAETTDMTGLKCCQLTHGGADGGWAQYCRTYQGECRQPYAQPIARALCEQKKTGADGSESYVVKEECPEGQQRVLAPLASLRQTVWEWTAGERSRRAFAATLFRMSLGGGKQGA